MKILVISDVHGNIELMNKIIKENNVDLKIFCGDLQKNDKSILSKNFDYYVTGNADYFHLDEIKELEVDKVKILLTHGHLFETFWEKINFDKLYKLGELLKVKLIIHGHDHLSVIEEKNKIIRFNPGSITYPRGNSKASYGIIEIKNCKIIKLKHIYI
ncbi:/ / phosphodiesterase family protein / 82721:83197 Forward [Candidatus Hepatoplasma crinochetorum]|uniref:Phosphoesterase n=1 Tax=Candidatus Hepatoplasma crinochetorum TaxID=295596 RepID=A0A0G7ZND7_9MOLU|nr:/ / phosphodiesterase family protein / 82721:83197 Forward [Candidatus Hepatoplasma crinochetorum]